MFFFFSSRRRHTRCSRDWSSDVCSSDLGSAAATVTAPAQGLDAVVVATPQAMIWPLIAICIYSTIAAIFLFRILIGVARVVWLSRSDQPGPDCNGVRVRVTGMVSSPVTFGSTIL